MTKPQLADVTIENLSELPRAKFVRASASQIKTFRDCPVKWFFGSILRIETPKSASLAFGSRIHQQMEDYVDGKVEIKDMDSEAVVLLDELYQKTPPDELERRIELAKPRNIQRAEVEKRYNKGEISKEQKQESLDLIEKAFQKKCADEGIFIDVEPSITFHPEGWEVPVIAKIDLLHREENKADVVDYKTTRSFSYANSAAETRDDPQKIIYTEAAFLDSKIQRVGFSLMYTKKRTKKEEIPQTKVVTVETVRDSQEHKDGVLSVKGNLRVMKAIAERPLDDGDCDTDSCSKYGGCPFKHLCPAYISEDGKLGSKAMSIFKKVSKKPAVMPEPEPEKVAASAPAPALNPPVQETATPTPEPEPTPAPAPEEEPVSREAINNAAETGQIELPEIKIPSDGKPIDRSIKLGNKRRQRKTKAEMMRDNLLKLADPDTLTQEELDFIARVNRWYPLPGAVKPTEQNIAEEPAEVVDIQQPEPTPEPDPQVSKVTDKLPKKSETVAIHGGLVEGDLHVGKLTVEAAKEEMISVISEATEKHIERRFAREDLHKMGLCVYVGCRPEGVGLTDFSRVCERFQIEIEKEKKVSYWNSLPYKEGKEILASKVANYFKKQSKVTVGWGIYVDPRNDDIMPAARAMLRYANFVVEAG